MAQLGEWGEKGHTQGRTSKGQEAQEKVDSNVHHHPVELSGSQSHSTHTPTPRGQEEEQRSDQRYGENQCGQPMTFDRNDIPLNEEHDSYAEHCQDLGLKLSLNYAAERKRGDVPGAPVNMSTNLSLTDFEYDRTGAQTETPKDLMLTQQSETYLPRMQALIEEENDIVAQDTNHSITRGEEVQTTRKRRRVVKQGGQTEDNTRMGARTEKNNTRVEQ